MRLGLIPILFFLGSCVSTGVQVKEDQLTAFEKGRTTISDVTQTLGAPTTNMVQPDGSRVLVYTYVKAQARPESYIPILGAFVGGADSKSSSVAIRFDARGVLIDYSSVESTFGTGTGLSGGPPLPRTDQPRQ